MIIPQRKFTANQVFNTGIMEDIPVQTIINSQCFESQKENIFALNILLVLDLTS